MYLFAVLVAVPLIEISLFIEIGGFIGLWPTLAIVVLTAAVGAALLRHQGLVVFSDLKTALAANRDPSKVLVHGLLVFVAGLVLLTPGFFTDSVGLLLLFPAVREMLIAWAGRQIASKATVYASRTGWTARRDCSGNVIEGSGVVVNPATDRHKS